MADSESFPHHQHYLASATDTATPTTSSFSQLLFCNDLDGDNCDNVVLGGPDDIDQTFHYSSIGKPPMMLCFGGYIENEGDQVVLFDSSIGNINEGTKVVTTAQRPGFSTCSGNSSASSGATANHRVVANAAAAAAEPNRKRDGSNQEAVQRPSTSVKATQASQRTSNKKTKMENPAATGNTRGRREKLGERITALQQLVSPFGKTDTASVLHEAMGYIRFLHDQVQVLCSPYLQHQLEVEEDGEGEETRQDLRSRGLCLVPVECTVHVSSTNGADYWSPAAAINDSSTAINYQAVNQN